MDGDSATVETQAPASYADRTVDTDDEAAGNAGPDYAEPPADAGGASNDVAAPSAQRTDSDDVSGEGNTGFAGGNGGGRPDMAQAGGKEPSKLMDALKAAGDAVKEALNA